MDNSLAVAKGQEWWKISPFGDRTALGYGSDYINLHTCTQMSACKAGER